MKNYHPILRQCPLFDGIQMEDLSAMLGCIGGRTMTVQKGGSVCSEGDISARLSCLARPMPAPVWKRCPSVL